ncbi:MAG: HAMP domain-containing histidine kinase [Atopobiaceae bacterium]|nr:HAMP domain-containing histidine kinase [Atopobiaceae bacterium]
MLRSLRIKFIAIIMALVGTVLISVLGGSFISAWQTQADMIETALERSINRGIRERPLIADISKMPSQDGPNMLILSVEVDETGMLLQSNDAPVTIDSSVLASVLSEALSTDADRGIDNELHIAWRRAQLDAGAWRVVIADTSSSYYTLRSLAIQDLGITVIAMGALFAISVGLSSWLLKPVERAWEQQRRFVADASHELKTPLAVIIANTQILAKDETLSNESRRWVDSTADESAHMKNLVEELLELARTDESTAGAQGVMRKADVDFSEVVENASLEFDAIAFERGCEIREEVQPGIHVEGDPEWLSRLAKILVDNACKYATSGTPINVTLTRDGKRCVLTVNNQGQTISPEDLEHIFDRFYRTDKARSREAKSGGFGLGLAIAKGIADSHGGEITAQSTDADGTTFRVVLNCL